MTSNCSNQLPILYQDDDIVIIDKPAGMLVHRTAMDRDHRAVLQLLRDQIGQRVNPVHRLDKPTSGVLAFALSSDMTRELQAIFDGGMAVKRYLALVRGYAETRGVIDYPLRQAPGKPPRDARTDFRRLATGEAPFPAGPFPTARYSLLEAQPITGRLHQIRRHCAHIRHPVLGDTTHGDGKQNKAFRANLGIHRLMLMARSLSFPHPRHGRPVQVTAPVPAAFAQVFDYLGWPRQPEEPEAPGITPVCDA